MKIKIAYDLKSTIEIKGLRLISNSDERTKIGRDDRGNQGRRQQQDNAMQCRQKHFRSANKAGNALNNNKPNSKLKRVSRLLI